MDAIYAISTLSWANVVRINILKVEEFSSNTLAYRALKVPKDGNKHKEPLGSGTSWMRVMPSRL